MWKSVSWWPSWVSEGLGLPVLLLQSKLCRGVVWTYSGTTPLEENWALGCSALLHIKSWSGLLCHKINNQPWRPCLHFLKKLLQIFRICRNYLVLKGHIYFAVLASTRCYLVKESQTKTFLLAFLFQLCMLKLCPPPPPKKKCFSTSFSL